VRSRFKHSCGRGAVSEAYSAAVVVAITLAVSYAVYSLAVFPVSPVPVYSTSSFSVYGSPSFLHLQVNSTSRTWPAEIRLDGSSSLVGLLALTASGYSNADSLCAPGKTTFFSVHTASGVLSISGSGASWIDGVNASSALVREGWHEVVISNGYGFSVTLPGGLRESGPSSTLSTLPMESVVSQSFLFLIPYEAAGHVATIVFDGGTQVIGF
jgi:hypothetical protein